MSSIANARFASFGGKPNLLVQKSITVRKCCKWPKLPNVGFLWEMASSSTANPAVLASRAKTDQAQKNEYKTDLKKLSKCQLQEILERQQKLVANSKALHRLPDNGEKILKYYKAVKDELEKKNKEYDLSDALAGLTLKQLDRLEWTRGADDHTDNMENIEKDDTNPFKILATHSGAGFHKKEIREEKKETSLVTERDLEDLYALKLCEKLDNIETKDRFRPYATLNTVKQLSDKERDLCAAAPPKPKYGDAKTVNLEESLRLMIKQNEQLRDIQMAHAAERLRDKTYAIGEILPSQESTRVYRDTVAAEEEDEVRDDCEGHDGGDVRFPIDFEEVD